MIMDIDAVGLMSTTKLLVNMIINIDTAVDDNWDIFADNGWQYWILVTNGQWQSMLSYIGWYNDWYTVMVDVMVMFHSHP